MSGIYIKGMKMPYRCCDCKLKYWDGEEDVCPYVGIIASIGRHDACPLISVPPHGRLIDADALIIQTILNVRHAPYISRSDVEAAPTIIEEEEGE